jgi:polar amino acid transport system substrate-binding protein
MAPNRARLLLAVSVLAVGLAACAPADEAADPADDNASASPTDSASADDSCATENLALRNPGRLTVGTDSPAFEPWFSDNDPSNGKGFESAVAYAVAEELGFTEDQVDWVKVPFNNSYAPGEKNFDFDINQISITPERAKVVDFSDGYYQAAQAVIALKGSPAAEATSLEELAGFKLGAQTGTTSLTAIRDGIQPDQQPLVFEDTNAAKQALTNGQLDAFLADLPTAFYITAVEIPKGTIAGQFQPTTGDQEEFGMLFEKGSELVPCVNQALAALEESGELADIERQWLSDVVDVPELQ